jgi:hypothetical protein
MNYGNFLKGAKTIHTGLRLCYTLYDSSSYYFELRTKLESGPRCVGLYWSKVNGGCTTSDIGETIVVDPNHITVSELKALVSASHISVPKDPLTEWGIIDWTIT